MALDCETHVPAVAHLRPRLSPSISPHLATTPHISRPTGSPASALLCGTRGRRGSGGCSLLRGLWAGSFTAGHCEQERLLLVWWGLARDADCDGTVCTVKPPAGPTEAGSVDCCGKRYYHGLQAWLVRTRSLRCLLRRLRRRPMKNIDALMVNCNCPRTLALAPGGMLGEHLDRELGQRWDRCHRPPPRPRLC